MNDKPDANISINNNIIYISGVLNFANVMQIYDKSLFHLKNLNAVEFDFSKVQSSNSAGLALVIEWIKYAKKSHKIIQFKHLTSDILVIAKVAGLDGLII